MKKRKRKNCLRVHASIRVSSLLIILLVAVFCCGFRNESAYNGKITAFRKYEEPALESGAALTVEELLRPVRKHIWKVSVIGFGFDGLWKHDLDEKPLFETEDARLKLSMGSKGLSAVEAGFGTDEYWFEDGSICFQPSVTGFYISRIIVEACEDNGARATCEISVLVLDLYQTTACVLLLAGALLLLRVILRLYHLGSSPVSGYVGVRCFDWASTTSDFTVKKISGRKMSMTEFGITDYKGVFRGIPLAGLPDRRSGNGIVLRYKKKSNVDGKRFERAQTVYLESDDIVNLTFQTEPGRGLTITFVSES